MLQAGWYKGYYTHAIQLEQAFQFFSLSMRYADTSTFEVIQRKDFLESYVLLVLWRLALKEKCPSKPPTTIAHLRRN